MDNNILESLANLERNLQGIKSAKEQVEHIATAYDKTETQFSKLRSDLASVTSDIETIISSIRDNQEALNGQIFDMAKARLSAFGSGVEELEKKANEIHSLFQNDCDKELKNLKDSTSAAVTTFEGSLQKVNKNQEITLSKMIEDFHHSINQYLKRAQELSEGLSAMVEDFKFKQQEFLNNTQQVLSSFKSEVKSDLQTLTNVVTTGTSTIGDALVANEKELKASIATSSEAIEKKVNKVDNSVIESNNQIQARLESMEARQKHIYIFSLIAMIISIIALGLLVVFLVK